MLARLISFGGLIVVDSGGGGGNPPNFGVVETAAGEEVGTPAGDLES